LARSWLKRKVGPGFLPAVPAAACRSRVVASVNWAAGFSSERRGETILAHTPARSRASARQPVPPSCPPVAVQTRGGHSWVTVSNARMS
jgi:hypothetical protein